MRHLHGISLVKTSVDRILPWLSCKSIYVNISEMRYLGIYLVAGRSFRVSTTKAHCKFSRAVNSIFSKLLGHANESVIVFLIKMKCLPILLYGTEVVGLNASALHSLDFFVIRFGMKFFRTSSRKIVVDSFSAMGLLLPSALIPQRYTRFKLRAIDVENMFFQTLF